MRKSGQITAFLSLVLLCVCSLVCGLVGPPGLLEQAGI